jgi:hypothetical protein
LPWGEWNGPSVDFPEALADLFLPGFFGSFVDGVIKAPDQRVDQGARASAGSASASLSTSTA